MTTHYEITIGTDVETESEYANSNDAWAHAGAVATSYLAEYLDNIEVVGALTYNNGGVCVCIAVDIDDLERRLHSNEESSPLDDAERVEAVEQIAVAPNRETSP